MKTKIYDSLQSAAASEGVPLATLKRWKKQGAPGFKGSRIDFAAASRWAKVRGQRKVKPRVTVSAMPSTTDLPEGAPFALARLQAAERTLFMRLQAAEGAGDNDEADRLREQWLSCTDRLRKQDNVLSESRRQTGEMMPRSDAEAVLSCVSYWLNVALRTFSQDGPAVLAEKGLTGSELTAWLFETSTACVESAIAAAVTSNATRIPEWAVKALRHTSPFRDSPARIQKLAEVLGEFVGGVVKAESK